MKTVIAIVFAAALAGCTGTARGLEAYRTDTEKLLESRTAQIQSCYDTVAAADPKAGGTVAVQFVVERKTGAVTKAALDAKRTSAPASVSDCVLKAVDGLKLDPPDRNEGQATFVYEFHPVPPAAS